MCRDRFAFEGKRVSHLIEHLFPTVAGADPVDRGWVSWSDRRSGRIRVKNAILRECGESEAAVMKEYDGLKLTIDPEAMKKIDSRRILEEDIRKVIFHAESTGKRMQSRESGNFLAYLQPANVTFWVEYLPEGDGFRVVNAYCHRMKIAGIKK
jgi:hypothetical protein